MLDPIVITAGVDPATGIYVEQHQRRGFTPHGAGPTFWCAYPADRSPVRIATGDSKAEAIAKLVARNYLEAAHAA